MKHKNLVRLLFLLCLLILVGCGIGKGQPSPALQEPQEGMQEDGTVLVHIGGTFTAMVRGKIPDYVTSSETPSVAVVTLFQSTPFLLFFDNPDEAMEQLEAGEYYVFEISGKQVEMSRAEYEEEPGFADRMIARYGLTISDFRIAGEDEIGIGVGEQIVKRQDKK